MGRAPCFRTAREEDPGEGLVRLYVCLESAFGPFGMLVSVNPKEASLGYLAISALF